MFQEFHDYNPKVVVPSPDNWQDYFNMELLLRLLWTVTTFLLIASYGSNLRSHLVVQEDGDKLSSIEQLLNE